MRRSIWLLSSCFFLACAPRVATPAQSPETGDAPEGGKPAATPTHKAALLPEPEGLPPAPTDCESLATRQPTGCAETRTAQAALADALETESSLERDAKLACLETHSELP